MESFVIGIALAATVLAVGGCSTQSTIPEIIAHRGASHNAPENTLAAVEMAWELGADAVEVDVHRSADNRVVVLHDASTKRTTGVEHIVAETSSDILRSLDAGSFKDAGYADETIPFLDEVLAAVPAGKHLYIELKSGMDVVPGVVSLLEDSDVSGRCRCIAFDFDTIAAAKQSLPGVPCYWLAGSRRDESTGSYLPHDDTIIDRAASAGLDGVDVHWGGVTQEFVDAVHERNMGCYVWTVNDPAEFARLSTLGVDGITTDRPAWIREQTAELY